MTEFSVEQVHGWLEEIRDGRLQLNEDNMGLADEALALLEVGAMPAGIPAEPATTTPSVPLNLTNTSNFMYMVTANLYWLEDLIKIPVSDAARVLVMAIAGQESNWAARLQNGGPARSFWQFEKGGGVHGVLQHAASSTRIQTVCTALRINCDVDTVYQAMAWNDQLAVAMARLLLLTEPSPLPAVGSEQAAWNYYLDLWRPGKPHPEFWPERYRQSVALL